MLYRVTYVESVLRERLIEAESPKKAEDAVMEEIEYTKHHHVTDSWTDDFVVQPYKRPPLVNRYCFECGEER